jgi:hypothetical protein
MNRFAHLRGLPVLTLLAVSLALLPASGATAQQSTNDKKQTPLVPKPDAPGLARNHRLILKDGTYQLVRQYTIAGDRVRYLSLERGEWKKCPPTSWIGTLPANGSATTPNPTPNKPRLP